MRPAGNPKPPQRPSVFFEDLKPKSGDEILSLWPASIHNGANRRYQPSCARGPAYGAIPAAGLAIPAHQPWHIAHLRRRRVAVLHPGFINHEAGPNFRRAFIQIGRAAPIECDLGIDLVSEGWRQHGHNTNPAFAGVGLHIVWQAGENGPVDLPVVELKDQLDAPLGRIAQALCQAPAAPPPGPLGRATLGCRLFPTWPSGRDPTRDQGLSTGRHSRSGRLAAGIVGGTVHRLGLQTKQLAHAAACRIAARAWPRAWPSAGAGRPVGSATRRGWPFAGSTRPRKTHKPIPPHAVGSMVARPRPLGQTHLTRGVWTYNGLRPANRPERRLALAAHWLYRPDFIPWFDDWICHAPARPSRASGLLRHLTVSDEYWSTHWNFRSRRFAKAQPLLGPGRRRR